MIAIVRFHGSVYYIYLFCFYSLQYLNYPTQVIFKSCKLIPVLIGGILIQRKRKGVLDFIAALVMSIGLAVFILADTQVKAVSNITNAIIK